MSVKQVIVMRTKYPDDKAGVRGLRTGKLIAQGSHASLSFMTRRIQRHAQRGFLSRCGSFLLSLFGCGQSIWTEEELEWMNGGFAKICVYVETEAELLDIYHKAYDAWLEVHLITDSGHTEFGGVPTNTCLAIGPHQEEMIDPITRRLPLL